MNIFKIFSKETETVEDENFSRRLIEVNRGRSFKGHACHLQMDNYHGDKEVVLSLSNQYFSGNVFQQYYTDKKITKKTFHSNMLAPKWMQKKYASICKQIDSKSNVNGDICWKFDNSGYRGATEIMLSEHSFSIERKHSDSGLTFFGHRDSIDNLRELSIIIKAFRKYFKKVEELDLCINIDIKEPNEDMYRPIYNVKRFSF